MTRPRRRPKPERKAPTGFIGPAVLDTTWRTPPLLVERVRRYFGGTIPHDVCTGPENPCGAEAFWTEADDALARAWPARWWCNPPYGRALRAWLPKMAEEAERGGEGVALLSCARWEQHPMQLALAGARALCLIRKRVDFVRASTGEPVSGNTYANMFVGFNVDAERWCAAFGDVGLCLGLRAWSVPPVAGIKLPRAGRARAE